MSNVRRFVNYTLLVVWGCLLAGVLLAALLGKVASKWGAKFGTSVGIGVFLFFMVNAALAACVETKLCPALGDTGIIYTLYPFIGIPVFFFVAKFTQGRSTKKAESE
jgi:hypothetical protein